MEEGHAVEAIHFVNEGPLDLRHAVIEADESGRQVVGVLNGQPPAWSADDRAIGQAKRYLIDRATPGRGHR